MREICKRARICVFWFALFLFFLMLLGKRVRLVCGLTKLYISIKAWLAACGARWILKQFGDNIVLMAIWKWEKGQISCIIEILRSNFDVRWGEIFECWWWFWVPEEGHIGPLILLFSQRKAFNPFKGVHFHPRSERKTT